MYVFLCPHCQLMVQVKANEINCRIFRHGIYKKDNTQLHPHAPEELCDRLRNSDTIWGCGRPFRFVRDPLSGTNHVEDCPYI